MPRLFMRSDAHSRNLRLHRLSDTSRSARDHRFSICFQCSATAHLSSGICRDARPLACAVCPAPAVGLTEIHACVDELRRWQDLDVLTNSRNFMAEQLLRHSRKDCETVSVCCSLHRQNPVAKGLVEKPGNWKASSANRKDLVTDPWPWLLDEN